MWTKMWMTILLGCGGGTVTCPADRVGPWPAHAVVHAVTDDPAFESDWSFEVATFVDLWNQNLVLGGCTPYFVVDPTPGSTAGHPIRLITPSAWSHAGLGSYETSGPHGEIDVVFVPNDSRGMTLYRRDAEMMHGLGHAIGLGNADPSWGASVMTQPPTAPHGRDFEAADCLLGCWPCDLNADPYDIPGP